MWRDQVSVWRDQVCGAAFVDGVLLVGVLGPQEEAMRASRGHARQGRVKVLVCLEPSGRTLEGLLSSQGRPRQTIPP